MPRVLSSRALALSLRASTRVFTTHIDTRDSTIVLGGVEVDDPMGLPLIEQLANLGEIDTSGVGGSRRALGAASPGALPAKLRKPAKPEPQPLRNWPQACADSLSAPRGGRDAMPKRYEEKGTR